VALVGGVKKGDGWLDEMERAVVRRRVARCCGVPVWDGMGCLDESGASCRVEPIGKWPSGPAALCRMEWVGWLGMKRAVVWRRVVPWSRGPVAM
jgi:hypothetical protein